MSGTYLVCDPCGEFGPPAGFFFKDGIRMCYECYFGTAIPEEKAEKRSSGTNWDKEDSDELASPVASIGIRRPE